EHRIEHGEAERGGGAERLEREIGDEQTENQGGTHRAERNPIELEEPPSRCGLRCGHARSSGPSFMGRRSLISGERAWLPGAGGFGRRKAATPWVLSRGTILPMSGPSSFSGREMPQTAPLRLRPIPRPMLAAGAVFGVFVAATLALWAYYGSTVFFETIAAGIAACL